MRTRSAIVAAAFAAVAACATPSPAPPGWSPTPEEAAKRILGHWVVVDTHGGPTISGELIAVGIYQQERDSGTIYVGFGDKLIAVPAQRVKSIVLVERDPSSEGTTAWTWLGVLSTPSHGWLLGVTLPGWLLLGAVPAAMQGSRGLAFYEDEQWPRQRDAVRKFARFPQGLPPALAPSARKMRAR